MLPLEWQEEESALLRSKSSLRDPGPLGAALLAPPEPPKERSAFLQEELLHPMLEDEVACTAEQYFEILYSDESKFVEHYRAVRKDTELEVEPWRVAEEYGGLIRKSTFRSLCNSPMCPPSTSMTEWQHSFFTPAKDILTLENIQEAHDVPFGSYFEIQARWQVTTRAEERCRVELRMGVHFKKWCVMQGKIRNGAANEYKADAMLILDLAKKEIEEWKQRRRREEAPESSSAFSEEVKPPSTPPLSVDRSSRREDELFAGS